MSQQMTTALVPHVTEGQARAVAEAARETEWRQPSFAKEPFLGRFRLDLVHPHPRPTPADQVAGTQFLERLRAFCQTCDGQLVEREAHIPDAVVQGLADLGAFGIKIPRRPPRATFRVRARQRSAVLDGRKIGMAAELGGDLQSGPSPAQATP